MKYVNDTKAAKSISAYVLIRGSDVVGKILVHHGRAVPFATFGLTTMRVKVTTAYTVLRLDMVTIKRMLPLLPLLRALPVKRVIGIRLMTAAFLRR